jgi:hypothetical protein
VATLQGMIDRVRLELGDQSKTFVTRFVADGSTNRFKLSYAPVEAASIRVFVEDGINPATEVTDQASVEEATGILIMDFLPPNGVTLSVSGNYYRYFTDPEMTRFVTDAMSHHGHRRKDSVGRDITLETLPTMEEYPVALYASTLGLYVLATDASFDINIFAPDGVTIPRSERYRQLMEMIESRRQQYKELCTQLGIGMYTIDVFSLRRISKRTNRYVPVYEPMEVDDRSIPLRADLPMPTYGSSPIPWPTFYKDFLAFQGIPWSDTVEFTGDFTGKSFIARLLNQRGSVVVIRPLDLSVTETSTNEFTASLSLSLDETLRPPQRTWWSLASVDDVTGKIVEIAGGDFFIERARTVVV